MQIPSSNRLIPLSRALQGLRISPLASLHHRQLPAAVTTKALGNGLRLQDARQFSTSRVALGSWLEPHKDRRQKMAKGRPRVRTGGSTKGTTVVWGDYGLRMVDHHRRISAKILKTAADTITARLRGEKFRLYKRKCANVGVYTSGNEVRMGKGKGSFDHWATRMSVNQILFEIKGRLHEQVVRDAFRLAGNKLPGQWEFAKKGDAPVVGITKLDRVTLEELRRPRRKLPPVELPKSSDLPLVIEEVAASVTAQSGDFPHLLVYGPSGAGKKTRVVATLKELYGPGVEKIKIDARVFQTTSNRKLEFNIVASIYHLEITPSDVGNYDRVVVQDLLKEVAQTQQVDQSAKQRFKVVVINEADHLSRDAQAALRRTMEKYSPNLRLILLANSTSNIIAPIRSRTLLVRVAAPSHEEICDALAESAAKENWPVVAGLHRRIAVQSGRNLRRALLIDQVTESTSIPPADWEALIGQIAKDMMAERTPAQILHVRPKLYDLLTHCIPATTILKTLTFKLLSTIDDELKGEVIGWSAFYEHRIKTGTKVIFHLEAFVAKFMRVQEMYLMSMGM
ncbi:hypothetical protein CDD80_5111 [Ophiocordyceps camponoti-rufipedis]|uniref:Replication factor C subunit 5 n=1 Tax=Ophiocordyceps camponoti-rufipedis TaxID=2004952 RepID=A0A2C5YXH4_9HYPO|nr:hypothetical protein CDD80_5111 [Ophiocordyceps camponoti-rufipedis]